MNRDDIRFEVIEEATITPAQDAEIKALLCAAFPNERETFSMTRAWHGSAALYSVIARKDGRVVGNVGVVARDIQCGRTPVRVAGIQNVGVHPDLRGKNLGGDMLGGAMKDAFRRGIAFGLLFCTPGLERYYASNGWRKIDVGVVMTYLGETGPIPGKNIAMVIELGGERWPEGDIDLCGADW